MRKKSFAMPLVLIIVAFGVGVAFGGGLIGRLIYFQLKTETIRRPQPESSPTSFKYQMKGHCAKYGVANKAEFLKAYRAKAGDTLLSIAKMQLGDTSRVQELILLNKDTYPTLSLEKPFIEVDWVIYLPPDFINSVKNDLAQVSGELVINPKIDQWWRVHHHVGESFFIPNPRTQLTALGDFKTGDCVMVLMEKAWGGFVYSLKHQ